MNDTSTESQSTTLAPANPVVVRNVAELRRLVSGQRRQGKSIGFVPTMGALHAGHLSLVEAARRETDFVIVSIFVNPTQFGPHEDFSRYPRDLDRDLSALAPLNVDLVFCPGVETIYPPGYSTFVEVGDVAAPLEGACRPGHFRGVATVVLSLFNLAAPDVAFFGHKDFQQTAVVRKLTADLHLPVAIRVCPTVREADGLALSSRNVYLNAEERRQALALSQSLDRAAKLASAGQSEASSILAAMRATFDRAPDARLEYVALVNPETFADVESVEGPTLAAVAAYFGSTRLIDNRIIAPPPVDRT